MTCLCGHRGFAGPSACVLEKGHEGDHKYGDYQQALAIAAAKELQSLRDQLAEAQARIDELTTMCEDLVCEAKDFAYKLEQKTVQLVEAHAALTLKGEALYLYRNAGNPAYDEMVKQALAAKPDNSALREWGARLLEEYGCKVYDGQPSNFANRLRSGAWTPEIMK